MSVHAKSFQHMQWAYCGLAVAHWCIFSSTSCGLRAETGLAIILIKRHEIWSIFNAKLAISSPRDLFLVFDYKNCLYWCFEDVFMSELHEIICRVHSKGLGVFINPHLGLSSRQHQNNKVSKREQYITGKYIKGNYTQQCVSTSTL